jgi:hypothetical protein
MGNPPDLKLAGNHSADSTAGNKDLVAVLPDDIRDPAGASTSI